MSRSRFGFPALVALAMLVLIAPAAPAQSPSPPPTPAPTPSTADWVGVWQGPFFTDGPSGMMRLTIQREGPTWKIDTAVDTPDAPPPGEIRDWTVEQNRFSFVQTFGDYEVTFRGVLEQGLLKGTIEAYQAGSLALTGSFSLAKQ